MLCEFKTATWAISNIEKTTILPFNKDETWCLKQKLPTIKIKQQQQTMLILGVTFFNGLTQWDNLFPIPITINTKIQKISSSTVGKINKYKLDPIGKQTLFLQKENGRFNLKEPETTKNPTCGLTYLHIDLYNVSPEYENQQNKIFKPKNPFLLFWFSRLYLKKSKHHYH